MAQAEIIKYLTEEINKHKLPRRNMLRIADDFDIRVCTVCNKLMYKGYCIEGGVAYYCSDDCMKKDGMTKEQFDNLYDNGEGDSYWTEWI